MTNIDLMTRDEAVQKNPWPGLTEKVRAEVDGLSAAGIDVQLVPSDFSRHFTLTEERQRKVNEVIDYWSRQPKFADILLSPEASPVGAAWRGIAKRAIALHPFYNIGEIDRPSDGIDPHVLDEPMFAGRSARQLVQDENSGEQNEQILSKYDEFFNAGTLWEVVGDGISVGELIAGTVDRLADVTRAEVAIGMIREHIDGLHRAEYKQRGVVSASLACGAAEPVFWLSKRLEEDGIPVHAMHLVDSDPVALAVSTSRAKAHGVEEKVVRHRKNILKTPPISYIEPKSVDIVDMIGLFEYLPKTFARYQMAGNLMADVAQIVRPGGMIVFGNMLDSRPQQEWFSGIWPPLKQRSIGEVIDIVKQAGFHENQLSIRIAEGEGVYALYGLKIPENGDVPAVSPVQREIGKRALRRFPEY